MIEDLTNISLSAIKSYDPDEYESMLNIADRDLISARRKSAEDENKGKSSIGASIGGVLGLGAAAYFTGGLSLLAAGAGAGAGVIGGGGISSFFKKSTSTESIVDRMTGSEIKSERTEYLSKQIRKDVETLTTIIVSLVKDSSMLESKNIFTGNLASFLFEADTDTESDDSSESKQKEKVITLNDIRDQLRGSGILIYKGDTSNPRFKTSEKKLIGSIAALLKTHFGIQVKGRIEDQLDLNDTIVSNNVNAKARSGEVASESVALATAGAGVVPGLNAPFDLNQMAAMVNMMGGNPMMMFMMMMMNPQFMQQMMQMQKKGATFGEAASFIERENPELENFEKSLEIAIQEQRNNLQDISSQEVKKVI